jgi:chloride channel protein, CIC family
VSALLLRRSVLTEKVARRGLHLSREYAVDPLEVLLVDEVMDASPLIAAADESLSALGARADLQRQWLYPVIDEQSALLGVIPRRDLMDVDGRGSALAGEAALSPRLVTYPNETLRELARRFATEHLTTALVLDRNDPSRVVGLVTAEHLLQAHLRDLVHERHRERFLQPRSSQYRATIS